MVRLLIGESLPSEPLLDDVAPWLDDLETYLEALDSDATPATLDGAGAEQAAGDGE